MAWVGGSWVWDPQCRHVTYKYFYAISNALSQQRFCPRSLSCVNTEWPLRDCAKDVTLMFCQWFTFCYLFYFFITNWKFSTQTRHYKTIWLTRTSFLWLIRISYFSINVSYRKSEHLIRKEFVRGVVLIKFTKIVCQTRRENIVDGRQFSFFSTFYKRSSGKLIRERAIANLDWALRKIIYIFFF